MTFRDYSFGYRVLGEGLSSVVYKAKKYKSKQQYALKLIKEEFLQTQFKKKLLQNEINIHEAISNHKNIVTLIQHGKYENSYVLVMEYCQKGSLADFLQKNKKISESQAIYIIKEVIEAYKVLNSLNILHRDLKPANILITQKNEVKLCDFGLSVRIQDFNQVQTARIGTPCFMAPEVARKAPSTVKSDIWSIGVTYFLMLTGQLPFKSHNYQNFLKQVDQINLQQLTPSNLSQFSKTFILRTLNKNQNQRMAPEQLFNFKFQSKPQRTLKPCVSQRHLRPKENQSMGLIKTISSRNLQTALKNQTLCPPYKDHNFNLKNLKETQETQSSQTNLKTLHFNFQQSPKNQRTLNNVITLQTQRIPLKSVTIRTSQDQLKNPLFSPRKNQTPKNTQKRLTKQEEKILMKQMQKITKILMNQVDFLRYTTKMSYMIEKYFMGEFSLMKEMMRHFVCARFMELKGLSFIEKDKIKTYMKFPIYKAWIQLLDDYSKTIKYSQKGKFRQQDFQKLLSKVILEIYMEYDISVKTKLNASKLMTLDHLICFRALLQMHKKGESSFLKNSMLNLILQGIEKTKIETQDIQEVFLGISKKLTASNYS